MRKKGLTEKEYMNLARNDWHRFVIKPAIAPGGFEPPSPPPEGEMIGRYTTGLHS